MSQSRFAGSAFPGASRVTHWGPARRDWGLAGWLAVTLSAFAVAEVVSSRDLPTARAAAVAAVGLRVLALLATLAAVLGASRKIQAAEIARQRQAAEVDESKVVAAERAHEARTALAAIEHAARALQPVSPAEESSAFRDAIVAEVALLRRLLDDRPRVHVDYELMAALGPALTSSRLAGVDLDVRVAGDLAARGDPAALTQAVQAVLDNARKHAAGASVLIEARRSRRRVVVVIGDTGPGIPGDLLPHVRTPGVRSPGSGGSGLGLAVVSRLVQEQGGEFRIASIPGAGSCFEIELPAATSVPASRPGEDFAG